MLNEMNSNLHTAEKSPAKYEHEIHKLNIYIKAITDSAFSYALLLDSDGKILYFSDSLLNLAKLPDKSVFIGMPILDAYEKLFSDKVFISEATRRLSRIMSGENELYEDDIVSWPTGEKNIYRITYKRIEDKNNGFYGISVFTRDITDIRLEEANRRLNDLLYSSSLPCLIWDETGRTVAYNKEAARTFGASEDLSPDEFNVFFLSIQPEHQPDGKETESIRQNVIHEALEKGFSQVTTVWLKKEDGTAIYFMVNTTRISWLFGYRLVVYYYDQTDIMIKEAEAREAEKQTRLVLDAAPLGCFLMGDNFRIIDCNYELLQMFDVPYKKTLIDDFLLFSPELQPDGQISRIKAADYLNKAHKLGHVTFEWMHQNYNGEPIPTEVTLTQIKHDNKSRLVSYIRDLREYKKMMKETNEASERIRLMLDSNPMICILRDEKNNIIDCNQAALDIFGVANKADLIRDYYKLYPEFQPDGSRSVDKVNELIHDLFGKCVKSNFEWMFRTFSGEPLPVESTFIQIQWEGIPCILSYSRDLREVKAKEQQMRESAERERTAILQKEAAQVASKAKGQFLANMSHEIRTPMNSIIGFSELAIEESMSPKSKEYLSRIMDNSKWLLQIINDILDISKIESGNMGLENIPFDLHELLVACKSIILPKAIEKNIELYSYAESSIRKKLCGDPTRLRQVLLNLLTNAVKFTQSGRVSFFTGVEKVTEDAVTLRFEVKDSGIGMTPEQISKVFEPFMQADISTTRKYGGTGLGLSITKNILELMGSRLEIESVPGAGTTVSFTVTINMVGETDDTLEIENIVGELDKPLFKGEVLVCEDNKMNQQVIIEHLARVGLTADIAENGLKGVEKVRRRIEKGEKPYDLIFMDIHMPVMDGIDATPKIIGLGSGSPIVAMTANIMTEDRELYKTLGMNDYVGKPFTSQELWRCLLKYLKPVSFMVGESDDEKLQNQLKAEFVRSNQNRFDEITFSIETGDITLAHRLAHSLKSNAGLIGRTDLQKAAADVESALKDGNNMLTEAHINLLRNELSKVLYDLKPYLKETANPVQPETSSRPIDGVMVLELFEKLEPLLSSGSPESLKLVEDLRGIPGSDELIEQIEDFYFGSAVKTLAELKEKLNIG